MQKHVDLENGPFVRSIRFVSLVQNFGQHVAAKVIRRKRASIVCVGTFVLEFNHATFSREVEVAKIDPRPQLRSMFARRLLQCPRNVPHSSNWHLPFASLITDQMI
jgi:hypothetical protein